MMKMAEQYAGFGWIKVKRAEPVEIEGVKYVSEDHHAAETNFLIEEIRKLAAQIDELNQNSRGP